MPLDANASPSEISEKALDIINEVSDSEAESTLETIVTAVHKGANAVAGLAETLTAVQAGRAQHVVALADFHKPAYRFVDTGYIVLNLDDETELGSGKVQELPDGVESVLRRAMAQGIGVTRAVAVSGLARAIRHSDHHADRQGRRDRPRHRSRNGRRRLPAQAVRQPRADRPHPRGAAPRRP